jgi:hypothetical protein
MVSGRYDQICAQFPWNVLEHFNFATDEAAREMLKTHAATREPDVSS